ncbi:hypothetical protein [Candidatus Cardinium hertigii]|uniref:Uncharacterized protein n=1 Tax=Candidatus Cardinium hertigii TaxID=247481 RepID=A0A3N2QD30_9BACT|nr:hypothetical protein [Candidatus Cardinium hertigii]ROT47687.1 hypothetical protein EDM02_01035 [Candidatus Cardinium hertigii]
MYVSKDKEDNHFTHNSTQNATDYHVTRNGLKKGLKKLWTNKIKKLKTITYRLLTLQYKEATLFCLEQKLEKLENKKETLTQKRATIDTVTELTKLKKCKKKKLDLKIRMKEFKIKLITKQIQKKQVNSEKCTNNLPYSQFSPTTPQTNSEKCTNNNLLYPQLLPTAPYDSPPYDHPPPYSLYTTPPYP